MQPFIGAVFIKCGFVKQPMLADYDLLNWIEPD